MSPLMNKVSEYPEVSSWDNLLVGTDKDAQSALARHMTADEIVRHPRLPLTMDGWGTDIQVVCDLELQRNHVRAVKIWMHVGRHKPHPTMC